MCLCVVKQSVAGTCGGLLSVCCTCLVLASIHMHLFVVNNYVVSGVCVGCGVYRVSWSCCANVPRVSGWMEPSGDGIDEGASCGTAGGL